jgi:DNA-binding beta-propeller fold protein YncE
LKSIIGGGSWDVGAAVYEKVFSVAAQETSPQGIAFSSDGTKMYVVGYLGDDVNQYTLSTAWDIGTAVYLKLFSVVAQETAVMGIAFSTDGTKMYMLGQTGDDVNQYTLSTAWDVGTASYQKVFSVNPPESDPRGITFSFDGTKMYIVGTSGDAVYQYTLSTAWDVGSAVYQKVFSVAAQESDPSGIAFSSDGTRMYIVGFQVSEVNQYTLQ